MSSPLADLQAYAESQLDQHALPAVSLAVWRDGQLHTAAAGSLNLNTGVDATPDSIFQIGSISKVMTACLVMQLVDEGKVDLDTPVKHYLRDFLVADPVATAAITVRQLLDHSSGLAGDFFPDDDGHTGHLIARYVDRCNLLPLVHPVGEMFSYSNSAYVIAGRLVEVIRGMGWSEIIRDYLFKPLGMAHALADPKEAVRYRTAMGHVFDGGDTTRWVLPEQAWLPLGMAPCGAAATMSAEDLITFARAHLDGGLNRSGERWLSTESVLAMQTSQRALPRVSQLNNRAMGLGWMLDRYQTGERGVGHGGATNGFLATLQMIPEQQAAYAVLLNGFRSTALQAINRDLLLALTGIDLQEPEIEETGSDISNYEGLAGQYESFDTRIDVSLAGEKLSAHIVYKIDPLPPLDLALTPLEANRFAAFMPDGVRRPNLVFLPEDAGVPQYLFYGNRLNARC